MFFYASTALLYLPRDAALANDTRKRDELHPASSPSCHLQYLCSALRKVSYLHKHLRATQLVVGIKREKELFTALNVLHVTAWIIII